MTPLLQPLRELRRNGWFRDCWLSDAGRPLTHRPGYALRGVIEAYRLSPDQAFLAATIRTADGPLTDGIRGGVKGSFPLWGEYLALERELA